MAHSDEFEESIGAPDAAASPDEQSRDRRTILKNLALAGVASPTIIAILSQESAAHAYPITADGK